MSYTLYRRARGGVVGLLVVLGLCGPHSAWAQVHVENASLGLRADGLSLSSAVRTGVLAGNIRMFDLFGTAVIQYQTTYAALEEVEESSQEGADAANASDRPAKATLPPATWSKDRFLVSGHGTYRTLSGEVFGQQFYGEARYSRMLVRRVGVGVAVQASNDAFARLDLRAVGYVGVRALPINTPAVELRLGLGYAFEHEVRNVPPDGPDPMRVNNHRWTAATALRWTLPGGVLGVQNTVIVSPVFVDPADVQVLDAFNLSVALSKVVGFQSGVMLRYDARPPVGVAPLDVAWTTGVSVTWAGLVPRKASTRDVQAGVAR